MDIPKSGIKLNLGCGKYVLDGWVNVDAATSPQAPRPPELLCDVKSISLPDECATEVMAIHLWEHLYRWECEDVIAEWRRLLRPGGMLVLEMPDLFKLCRNLLETRTNYRGHPDQMGLRGLFGDPTDRNPLMIHRWGWTYTTLAPFLEDNGFMKCIEAPPQWHPVGKDLRDFRIEAQKK